MFPLARLLTVFIFLNISFAWDCPTHSKDASVNGTIGNSSDGHYPSNTNCTINFVVPKGYYVSLGLTMQLPATDTVTVSDDYGFSYLYPHVIFGSGSHELAANFSVSVVAKNSSTGKLILSWTTFPATIDDTFTANVVSGAFQTIGFITYGSIGNLCNSSRIAQKFIATEPIVLIFAKYSYPPESTTFFYQGDAITGKYLGGVYSNRPNITVDTIPYTLTVVSDCTEDSMPYRDTTDALLTQLNIVQQYSSYVFYIDRRLNLDLATSGSLPAAAVVGRSILALEAILSENAYGEWYTGIAKTGDIPLASFTQANTTSISAGIYLPEGGNTVVVHHGSLHLMFSSQVPTDTLPIAAGLAIAVTPNYGTSGLYHTYNWSFVADDNNFYDIDIISVDCDNIVAYFNFIYFGRSIRLHEGYNLKMFHMSEFRLQFIENGNSTGGKVLFNATVAEPFIPIQGTSPVIASCRGSINTLASLLLNIFLNFFVLLIVFTFP